MVLGQAVLEAIDRSPVEAVPNFAPIPLGIVGHFEDVGGAADVGFGGEGRDDELGHAVDIGFHDPLGGVDEHLHEVSVNLGGLDVAHEHRAAEDHEALDVVAPAGAEGLLDGSIEGREAGGATVPIGAESAGAGAGRVPAAFTMDAADEFAPADDLADEAFEGVEGDGSLGVSFEGRVQDLLRGEKTDVEEGREEAVVENRLVGGNRVFVVAKLVNSVFEKVFEESAGGLVGYPKAEGGGISGVIGEVGGYLGDDLLGDGVVGGKRDVGGEVSAGEALAVGFVEAPFAAGGMAVGVDQDAESNALGAVEIRHQATVGSVCVAMPLFTGGEEHGVEVRDEGESGLLAPVG